MKTNSRKFLSLFLATIMMISVIPLGAVTATAEISGDFGYSVISEEEKTCEMTKYNGTTTELTIPSQLNEYTVTGIGEQAFYGCTSLTSITIPEGVTSVGGYAFYNCTSLASITIPDSVTKIGERAFYNTAYYNTESNWENDVLYIGNHFIKAKDTLSGEYNVKQGTKSVARAAFEACNQIVSVIIPDGIISVDYNVFENCTSLTNVILPDSVMNIGWYAFSSCTSLTSITIPDSVTEIGGYAFENCTSLEKVVIPDGVKLREGVFRRCSSLKSVKIPYGNWTVDTSLFAGCTSLTEVIIPDSVTRIGLSAFASCESLIKLTIPSSVTGIGDSDVRNDPFSGCISLTDIDVDADNPEYSSIDGVLFNKEKTKLIKYPQGKKGDYSVPSGTEIIGGDAFCVCNLLTSVTIPDSVATIEAFAFTGCTSLVSVAIGNSVTRIEYSAFKGCSSLESITIPKNVTYIGGYAAFEGCTSLTIYGYSGSYAETYANENSIPFVALKSIVQFDKSQIRFHGVGADKDFTNYKDTFDVRTVAKISQEDFRNTFGTDEEALKNITDIGFIYAAEKNVTTFDLGTAKKVAEGTGTDENYIKKSVSNIQHAGDGADYIFTCIVTDVPDADKEQKGYCFAYVCCNGTYYYFDDVTVMDFNALYTANKPQA